MRPQTLAGRFEQGPWCCGWSGLIGGLGWWPVRGTRTSTPHPQRHEHPQHHRHRRALGRPNSSLRTIACAPVIGVAPEKVGGLRSGRPPGGAPGARSGCGQAGGGSQRSPVLGAPRAGPARTAVPALGGSPNPMAHEPHRAAETIRGVNSGDLRRSEGAGQRYALSPHANTSRPERASPQTGL